MDFSLSDDQQSLRELAREILGGEATPERLKQVESGDERVDLALWKQLARANLLGVAVSEAHGGMGLGLTELCLLVEEVGRAVAPVPVVSTLVHGALVIEAFGSDEQKAQWLPGVVAGDVVLAGALVETAESGLQARPEGGGFRLTGSRPLVPQAHLATRVLVPARSGDDGIGLFLVDPRGDGVGLERAEVVDQQFHSNLRLEAAPAERLGSPADGSRALAFLHERAVLAACALQLGVVGRALEMTAEYTSERRQFDRPVGSFQAVHMRAGDAYVDLQCMRLTTWRALHLLEHGEDAEDALAVAKYWASEAGARIAYAAQHLHGGTGVDVDYPLFRHYLWATHGSIALGNARQQLESIGARIAS